MLYKRGKVYYVKLKHRGSVIRKSTCCTNKRDAARVQEQWRAELKTQRKTSGHTFTDSSLRWLAEKQHKRSIETDMIVLQWFAPRLERLYLSEITRDKIEELRQELREDHKESSVNRYFQVLRAILRTARDDWEWIEKIPKVPMYPKTSRSPRFLSWEEWLSLQACLPPYLSSPAWFAVSTGLRTRPIQCLQWDWISRDGVRFPPEVMKNKEWLTIPLSMTAWYVIAESMGWQDGLDRKRFVFVNDTGMPWGGKFTTRAWKKAATKVGLPDVTFHDLRHTWASWMLQKGVPMHVVQELGGWRSREAMEIYARFSTESLERLAGYV